MPLSGSSPAPVLSACCVAVSGKYPNRTHASILADAEAVGATVSKSITANVSHLITSRKDCDQGSTKVTQANELGIFIVSLDWLLDCKTCGTKQPETDYVLTSAHTKADATVEPELNASLADTAVEPSDAAASTKRQASDSLCPEPKKSKLADLTDKAPAIGKSQIAKNWAVKVPLDEGCPLSGYGVHVDDDSVIWDASLNQANSGKNANKFYRLQLLVGPNNHCQTWTRWGRVGDRGQHQILGSGSLFDAMSQFKSKFKAKTGLTFEDRMNTPKPGRYAFVELNYDSESDDEPDGEDNADAAAADGAVGHARKPPPCTLDDSVQSLMRLIFNQRLFAATMLDMNYDNKKLPLGKLSRASIMRGFSALKDLAAMISSPGSVSQAEGIEETSNLFYSLIPHIFGRSRPPIIDNLDLVKTEIDLLETLADMKDATDIMKSEIDDLNRVHPLDRQFQGLGLSEMTPLDHESDEFKMLETYLSTTKGSTHTHVHYQVVDIFRVERNGESERFAQSTFLKTGLQKSDRRLLWHGSRATNFGGILSQGLRIAPPEAPSTGYMFGKGVYLADMSSKSVNYCYSYLSDNTALLLLCEAELGDPMHKRTTFQYDAAVIARQKGSWSTFGMGAEGPSRWQDADCVHPSLKGVRMPSTMRVPPGPTGVEDSGLIYNEYICYEEDQVQLRYLFRVNMI
ncbi:unnamed protein product [Discula destructiva]